MVLFGCAIIKCTVALHNQLFFLAQKFLHKVYQLGEQSIKDVR